jgi:hypothetical protein
MPYKDPQKKREYQKKWDEKNSQKRREYQKKRYKEKRIKQIESGEPIKNKNEYQREYQKKKSKEDRTKRFKTPNGKYLHAKNSAKRRKYDFCLSFDEYKEIIKSGICHYCGNQLPQTGSGLDRKDNEPYYKVINVIACCTRCNTTFMHNYSYAGKLLLAEAIKKYDALIKHPLHLNV